MCKVRMVLMVCPQGLAGELGDNLDKVLHNAWLYYFFSLCTWQVVNVLAPKTLYLPRTSSVGHHLWLESFCKSPPREGIY